MTAKTILFGGSGVLGPVILEEFPDIVSIGRTPPPPYVKNRHIPLAGLDDWRALDALDFDRVIFLIGNSNHHLINTLPTMGLDFNVLPLKKILFYLQNRSLKKFVCFSSILLYDVSRLVNPVGEDQPINPYVNDYIFSKYLSEEIAKFYSDKAPIIVVRLSNIYGPTRLSRPDLVPSLIRQALSSDEIKIWNTTPVRDFLYLGDAAHAVVRLLDTDYTGVINVGSGRSVSVGRIAQIIESLSGRPVKNLNQPVSGPMHFTCDISRLQSLTGWQPRFSIEEGLRLTYTRMRAWSDAIL